MTDEAHRPKEPCPCCDREPCCCYERTSNPQDEILSARATFREFYRASHKDADFTKPIFRVEWSLYWAGWQAARAADETPVKPEGPPNELVSKGGGVADKSTECAHVWTWTLGSERICVKCDAVDSSDAPG